MFIIKLINLASQSGLKRNGEFMRYKGHRVGVFVDVQNLYYSAKNLYNALPNYKAILKTASQDRQLVCAFAYVVSANIPKQKEFFTALESAGIEVKQKDLQIFPGGMKKGNWDVGMAVDILRFMNRLDVVVLVSGDGDFAELVEYLKNQGVKIEIMAFSRTCSKRLIEEAHHFIDLDKDLHKYLMKRLSPWRR